MTGALLLSFWLSVAAAAPTQPAAHSQTPAPCCVAPQPAPPDPRGTPKQPLAVQVTNLPPPPAPPQPRTDWAGVTAAGATVFVALGTLMLWLATRALLRGADETARRELRAYVFVNNPWVEGVGPHAAPVAHVPFKNYGRTPAYRVRATINVDMVENFADVAAPDPLPDTANGHLGPDADYQTFRPLHRPLTGSDPASLSAGHMTLFAYGEIHYIDAFKQPHWTKFRVMTGGTAGLRARRPDGQLVLVSCREGNDTDDDI